MRKRNGKKPTISITRSVGYVRSGSSLERILHMRLEEDNLLPEKKGNPLYVHVGRYSAKHEPVVITLTPEQVLWHLTVRTARLKTKPHTAEEKRHLTEALNDFYSRFDKIFLREDASLGTRPFELGMTIERIEGIIQRLRRELKAA